MTALRFVFDSGRCTGCEACVVGCWMENRAAQTRPWRQVQAFNPHGHPALPMFHLSLACHHCAQPACMENCPAGAYTRDAGTGAVTIHPEHCLGCRYCTWACPHDAPRLGDAGTIEKCTFCAGRLARGQEPACVARCPVEALGLEPRDGATGPTPPGFSGWALGPGIRFIHAPTVPVLSAPPEPGAVARCLADLVRVPEPRITLRGEWTLVAFTTLLGVLAARMAAGGPVRHPMAFLAAGAAAMALSARHLGRPGRAWRAVLNLRGSWLSREIVLASAFLALCAGVFLGLVPAWLAATTGFAALYAVDRVYQVAVRVPPVNFHSAHALLNGLYLAGILTGRGPLALAAGALKLALYAWRKAHFARQGRGWRPLLSLARVLAGFVLSALASDPALAAVAAVAGDLVDRCEYYGELEVPTPAAVLGRSSSMVT